MLFCLQNCYATSTNKTHNPMPKQALLPSPLEEEGKRGVSCIFFD
jgi:hypothetical protein